MRSRLVLPAVLAVTVVSGAGCAPGAIATDSGGASDGASAAPRDVAAIPPVDGGCYAGGRFVGLVSECLPSYPSTRCAVARACRTSECGAGCERCNEVFQCIPLLSSVGEDGAVVDGGALPRCDAPRLTCDRFGCEPGCQTFPYPRDTGGSA